jgi:hypothetical protein
MPNALTFEFCDDEGLKQEGKEGVRLVLHELKKLYKKDHKGQWDLGHVLRSYGDTYPNTPIRPEQFELGLYLIRDLNVLGSSQLNRPDDTIVTTFQIGEGIITRFKSLDTAWDETMAWHKPDAYGHTHVQTSPVSIISENLSDPTHPKFIPAGSEHDAYVEMRKIVQYAQKEILIVDTYVDHTTWELLTNVGKQIKIRILTDKMQGDFRLETGKFAAQHGNKIEVKTSKTCHDRFIIEDNSRCWHIGASIKDAGKKAFMFSELLQPEIVQFTIENVEKQWQSSISVQI